VYEIWNFSFLSVASNLYYSLCIFLSVRAICRRVSASCATPSVIPSPTPRGWRSTAQRHCQVPSPMLIHGLKIWCVFQ
jgi:hypothetical protein